MRFDLVKGANILRTSWVLPKLKPHSHMVPLEVMSHLSTIHVKSGTPRERFLAKRLGGFVFGMICF